MFFCDKGCFCLTHRTDRKAGTASCTFLFVDITGSFLNSYREIPCFSLYAFNLRKAYKVNIFMAAYLHKPGSHGAHCTVIRGKCFIKLCHYSADTGFCLNKIHFYTGCGKVKACLHSCNSSSDYNGGANCFFVAVHVLTLLSVVVLPCP